MSCWPHPTMLGTTTPRCVLGCGDAARPNPTLALQWSLDHGHKMWDTGRCPLPAPMSPAPSMVLQTHWGIIRPSSSSL